MFIPDLAHFHLFGTDWSLWTPLGRMNLIVLHVALYFALLKTVGEWRRCLHLLLAWTVGFAVGAALVPSVLGAVLGGFALLEIQRRVLQVRMAMGHVFAMLFALCIMIGRVGCFLTGCCFGSRCDLPWAVHYPNGYPATFLHKALGLLPMEASHSLGVHPTQLYEILFLLIALVTMFFMRKKMRNLNAILPIFLGAYLVQRVGIEFVRDMTNVWWSVFSWGPLSYLQWALLGLALPLFIMGYVWNRKPSQVDSVIVEPSLTKQSISVAVAYLLLLPIHNRIPLILDLLAITITLVAFASVLPSLLMRLVHQFYAMPRWFDGVCRPATIALLVLASLPFASRVFAQLDSTSTNSSVDTVSFTQKQVFYEVDSTHQKLVRTGDVNTTQENFFAVRQDVGLSRSPSEDSATFRALHEPRSDSGRYVRVGLGYQYQGIQTKIETGGCDGPAQVYYFKHVLTGGVASLDWTSQNNYYNYYRVGIAASYWNDRWSSVNADVATGGSGYYAFVTPNFAVEWRYFGFGLAFPQTISSSLHSPDSSGRRLGMILSAPGMGYDYIRFGSPAFSVRTGLTFIEALTIGKNYSVALGSHLTDLSQTHAIKYLRGSYSGNGWTIAPQLGIGDASEWNFNFTLYRSFAL